MNTIYYTKGYKYQLNKIHKHILSDSQLVPTSNIETGFISLDTSGVLTIQAGYAWDGPSGPTVDTDNFMRGSLVHDALYQIIREGRLPIEARYAADCELRNICIEDGMSKIRAWWVFTAVNKFAKDYAMPSSSKFVYMAP